MDFEIIPTAPNLPYPLGRSIIHHDPKNRLFRALTQPTRPARTKNLPWWSRDVYNQIDSDCTANAAVGLMRTYPFYKATSAWFADYDTAEERVALYREAQKHDPWDGEGYDGTSTDAPFRVLRQRGLITGWQWLFGEGEVREWLMKYGPVSVGTNWYDGMFYPDADGRLAISGEVAGGHAYRVVYWSPQYGYRIVNSWGREWGQFGRAWVPTEVMARLLSELGEAVTL
jgi:hypothetical protein